MILFLVGACGTAPPPTIDATVALAHLCEAQHFTFEADFLAVFEGPAPGLAVNVVMNDEIVVDGEALPSLDALREHLEEKAAIRLELIENSGEPELASHGDLLLQIAANTPADQVVTALRAAEAAGFRQIQFVGRSATAYVRPTYLDPAFADQLAATRALPAEIRQKGYEELTEGIVASCAPLAAALAEPRPSGEWRCEAFAETVQASLALCPEADGVRIVTLFQYAPWLQDDILTVLPTRLAPDGEAFAVRPTETWGDVVPRLRAAGPTTHWVVVSE